MHKHTDTDTDTDLNKLTEGVFILKALFTFPPIISKVTAPFTPSSLSVALTSSTIASSGVFSGIVT